VDPPPPHQRHTNVRLICQKWRHRVIFTRPGTGLCHALTHSSICYLVVWCVYMNIPVCVVWCACMSILLSRAVCMYSHALVDLSPGCVWCGVCMWISGCVRSSMHINIKGVCGMVSLCTYILLSRATRVVTWLPGMWCVYVYIACWWCVRSCERWRMDVHTSWCVTWATCNIRLHTCYIHIHTCNIHIHTRYVHIHTCNIHIHTCKTHVHTCYIHVHTCYTHMQYTHTHMQYKKTQTYKYYIT